MMMLMEVRNECVCLCRLEFFIVTHTHTHKHIKEIIDIHSTSHQIFNIKYTQLYNNPFNSTVFIWKEVEI